MHSGLRFEDEVETAGMCLVIRTPLAWRKKRLFFSLVLMSQDETNTSEASRDLYNAAFEYDVKHVKQLLDAGVSVVGAGDEKRTALHAVCWLGDSPSGMTLEQLAEKFVSGDRMSGSTKCRQIIDMLVAAGANVNAAEAQGSTPLHEAVAGDWANATAIRASLHYNAAVDCQNVRGETPLMIVVGPGQHQAIYGSASKVVSVKMLLAAGANPTCCNHAGLDVLCQATTTSFIIEELAAAGPVVHFRPTPARLAKAQQHLKEAVSNANKCVTLITNALNAWKASNDPMQQR